MIGYTLKHVLELVPEAMPLVKKANLQDEYPVNNKDGCIASALVLAYNSKQGRFTEEGVMQKIARATIAYGVENDVERLTRLVAVRDGMTKSASAKTTQSKAQLKVSESNLEHGLSGIKNIEDLTKQASEIYEQAQILGEQPSDTALKYSGNAYLVKSAAIEALGTRFYLTQNSDFVKIAAALSSQPDIMPPSPLIQQLCQVVTGMDKAAHLDQKGLDFYKETLILEKQAASAIRVKVAGSEYPIEAFHRVPRHHMTNYLGEDFCKELNGRPENTKAVVESLPMDMQRVLLSVMKNC